MSLRLQAPALRAPTIGLVGIGLVGGSAAAFAQEDPSAAAGGGTAQLPEMSVQGSAPNPYRADSTPLPRSPFTAADAPQTVNVVPRIVMEERAATTVREALRNVTGISLAAGEGGFSGDNLTLRGFSARSDFFIDGIRDFGQYTRDSFFLESVEVLKGPSSIMFGRGSTGGVINQITRLPLPTTQGEVWLSAYSPSGVRGTADVNVRAGEVAARMAVMATHIDASGRDNVSNSRWGVFPSVTFGMGTPTTLTLSWLHQEETNVPDFGVPYYQGRPLRVATNTFYGLNQTDREHTLTDVVTATLRHEFQEGVSVSNTTRWANYGRQVSATAPRLVASTVANGITGASLVNRQPQVRNGYDSILVNQTEGQFTFETWGGLVHSVVAGVELGRESSEIVRYGQTGRPQASLLFPDFYDTGNIRQTFTSDIKTVANTFSVYAVDRIRMGEMFEVMLGGRWDSFEAEQENRATGLTYDRTDREATWRAAFIFKPTPEIRTYISGGTSFNPSAESLTLAANNAALPPETATTYEIGGSWNLMDGLRLQGSVFRIEKRNARTSDPANDTLQVLDGVVRVDGFEISATGQITPEWNIMVGYTRLNSEIVESNNANEVGKEFANVAPNTASLWTTYNFPMGIQLGGGLSYVDRRYGNTSNTVMVPAYTRFDAAIAWQPQDGAMRGLRFQLNALNIGDTRTYDTVYTGHVVPGVGRTFVASVQATF
ncbi:TonB-dependent siderophore receptor [Roseomonas sp. JC162]|uniref:TonB-dependent siderophore receptor n=1 Tax=Neoroseomonas marina TaxID=1232220 RepID=A0A848EBC9_9PROT|nr:TonB-dependent siderophore receptor [Neoroseomonas marina]NMJ40763.1 TonB-dependent siderophore receptor [Neoroseomonas marina]